MPPVVFSPVPAGDTAALFDLFSRARTHDLGAAAWDESVRAATLRLQFDAQQRGYRERWPLAETTLLVHDGEAVGWAIVDRSGAAIHLVDIAVVPERRGRGAATAAIRALQDEAARAGRPVSLSVLRDNLAAIRLYSRLGFTPTGADQLYLRLTWQPPPAAPLPDAHGLSAAAFRAALDTWFEIESGDAPFFLLLKEVSERPTVAGHARFSLLFHGPGSPVLPQDNYALKHPAFADLELLLVPVIGSTPERTLYEVCISHLAGTGA